MDSLIKTLESHLTPSVDFRKRTLVQSVQRQSQQQNKEDQPSWSITTQDGSESYDAVICATRSSAASRCLTASYPELGDQLSSVEHVSTAVVCLGYRREQVGHPLNAFGCVIPAIERRKILAISFANVKFPTRAPADCVLLRVFVGGALQPELAELNDDSLQSLVQDELSDLLDVHGDPITSRIVRWPQTTPQYHIGHLQRIEEIERLTAAMPGFELAGNAYRGVGIPQCVRSGWQAADRILAESASS
jgi:oxygen-dependent protoporphyrinogen oxidase